MQYCHKGPDATTVSACSNKPFTGMSVTGGYIYRGSRLVHTHTAHMYTEVYTIPYTRSCIQHLCAYVCISLDLHEERAVWCLHSVCYTMPTCAVLLVRA
jgi:hypothetical protein